MLNTLRDVGRLDILLEENLALEKFSLNHFYDFFSYYYNRFLVNISSIFKDFTTSEISDFNFRHKQKLKEFFFNKKLDFSKILIPIPPGMIFSYLETLLELEGILTRSEISSLYHDLNQIHQQLTVRKIDSQFKTTYSDIQFEDDKKILGSHYQKKGLTHKLAGHVFKSVEEIKDVNDRLEEIALFYPQLIDVYKLFPQIEQAFKSHSWSVEDKQALAPQLLEIAHRLAIIGVTMQQVQKMEHAFTKTLNILLKEI